MAQEIEKSTQYADDEYGWAKRWQVEMDAADKFFAEFIRQGNEVVKRFKDDRATSDRRRKINLYHADVKTKKASVYGNLPQVEVGRRFGDPDDDEARVGGEMLERLINSDIEKDSDTFTEAAEAALDDWLNPGLGMLLARYVVEFETIPGKDAVKDEEGNELAPAVPEQEQKAPGSENVHIDYLHWRDVRWPACRTWAPDWIGFKKPMTREDMVTRFGEEIGNDVPLQSSEKSKDDPKEKIDPWARADVWEIWHKTTKQVFWWVKGYDRVLDRKDDPLGLDGFYPTPKPLIANPTTDEFIPTADFVISQDQYNAIDELYERQGLLEDALRVAFVYDRASAEVKNILSGDKTNRGYPVDSWAAFAEKGGIKGAMDFLPIDMIAACIDRIKVAIVDKINLLHQVNGIADIMRGGAAQSATATEQSIKAKFGSVRMQADQKEFARFITDALRIKAEIIAKHFEPQTIVERSNVMLTPDQALAGPAVQLIKSRFAAYRLEVKSDQISMTDYASLRAERTEFIQALPAFMTALVPVAQAMPGSTPALLKVVQWAVAGLRGSSSIEGVLDGLISQSQKQAAMAAQQPPKPSPEEIKAQTAMQATQVKGQIAMQTAQMKAQGDQMKIQGDMQQKAMEHQSKMAQIQATAQADLARIGAEAQTAVQTQAAQAAFNVKEEMGKAQVKAAFTPPTLPGQGGQNA